MNKSYNILQGVYNIYPPCKKDAMSDRILHLSDSLKLRVGKTTNLTTNLTLSDGKVSDKVSDDIKNLSKGKKFVDELELE